jgi:hypothetical protein
MPFAGIPPFRDGPGGTLIVSKTTAGTVGAQVTAGAQLEVGAVFAKAQVSISASLSQSVTTTVSHTFSHAITPGRFGNVRYVSNGRRVSWSKFRTVGNTCNLAFVGSGVINFPSDSEGWFYTETLT